MIDKIIKNIDELNGFEWKCRGKEFLLKEENTDEYYLVLIQKKCLYAFWLCKRVT